MLEDVILDDNDEGKPEKVPYIIAIGLIIAYVFVKFYGTWLFYFILNAISSTRVNNIEVPIFHFIILSIFSIVVAYTANRILHTKSNTYLVLLVVSGVLLGEIAFMLFSDFFMNFDMRYAFTSNFLISFLAKLLYSGLIANIWISWKRRNEHKVPVTLLVLYIFFVLFTGISL